MNFLFTNVYRYFRYSTSIHALQTIAVLFMCILNLYEAFCIADACEITMEQSSKTSYLLYRFNTLNLDAGLKQNIELFLIQLIHQPVKFTAFGMFTMGYTVLFSIITSVTSYLIIMIQFELTDNCTAKIHH
ncbi:putative gustatory receptor 28b [Topomyia yanbarensis]|uniref:putative gustatory receptor 28b n=1 Tax=Topomyia yanbarensis TaxID=2498891 RepID=UPI00273B3469|nr:putative gustatory receptor 28b [Topomyia yanbarensis]